MTANVNVPIPDGYIIPSGTLDITENGEHNVKSYEKVNVAVFGGGDCNAVEHLTAYELEDLILWYSIVWYASITTAVEDVKNGNIGANALADSTGATKFETLIIRTDTVPTLGGTNAFNNTKIKSGGTGFIYVKSALLNDFKSATNWSSLSSQYRAIEDYPEITGG